MLGFILGISIGIVALIFASRIAKKYNFTGSQKVWLGRVIGIGYLLGTCYVGVVNFVTYLVFGSLMINILLLHPWRLRDLDLEEKEKQRKQDIEDILNRKKD